MECLSVQKLALGACLTHNGLQKCNQFQRKVMASLHVHVCNNKGILTVLEYFYSSTVFVNVGGRGVKVSVLIQSAMLSFFPLCAVERVS